MPAKATLRKVVHRKPEPFMPNASEPNYLLCFITETLECGHTLTVFPQTDPLIAQRRRCTECAPHEVVSIAFGKKPVRGVALPGAVRKPA